LGKNKEIKLSPDSSIRDGKGNREGKRVHPSG
jgi:hypothetical protein